MPNIKPISDLENYTEVLNEVDIAVYSLFTQLKRSEERAVKEGWIDEDELDKLVGE